MDFGPRVWSRCGERQIAKQFVVITMPQIMEDIVLLLQLYVHERIAKQFVDISMPQTMEYIVLLFEGGH